MVVFQAKSKHFVQYSLLLLNGSPIEVVNNFKTLGVVFTEHMSWDSDTDCVANKAVRALGLLYRPRDLPPTKTRLLVYHSLFMPSTEYCFLVWGTTTSKNIFKLKRLQNNIRVIVNSAPNNPARPLLKKHDLVSLDHL